MTRNSGPELRPIGEVRPQQRVVVDGAVRSVAALALRGCPACRITLDDGTGELDLMFLGRLSVFGLTPGRRCRAEGRAAVRDDRVVLWNPRYELEEAGEPPGDGRAGGPPGGSRVPASRPARDDEGLRAIRESAACLP